MTKTPYAGKDIRLDGCFVVDPEYFNKYCEYYFFYSNGVFFHIYDKLNINSIYNFTREIDYFRNFKGNWGLFQVKNDTIQIQTWGSNEDNVIQFIVYHSTLKIINDSTLSEYQDYENKDLYFHFKKFNPKPDSTNVFIK